MKRLLPFLTILTAVLLVMASLLSVQAALAQGGEGEEPHGGEEGGEPAGAHGDAEGEAEGDAHAPTLDPAHAPQRGAALYAEFCQACHGPQGEPIAAGPAFNRTIAYHEDTTHERLASGYDSDPDDGVAMPAFAQSAGGVLSDQQISDLIGYMESWEGGETPHLPEPAIAPVNELVDYFGTGDATRGALVYAQSCYGCHGPQGEGRDADAFPPLEIAGDTFQIVSAAAEGSPNPYMPAFGQDSGGPLSASQLNDLEAYLASWQEATAEKDKEPDTKGVDSLLIVLGLAGILAVGLTLWLRPAPESEPDE